jgi:UDP-N-acetylglucosamine--N-acetylmuramyl-(pentapeptide) pyrophosphoryl-undecaprenol N-acetylglucosamine transferase
MKTDLLFIGGHHSSAVPLIKRFKKDGYNIKFIGHKYASNLNSNVSSEYKEISSLGIPYINLRSPKFYKVPGVKKYFALSKSFLFCLRFLLFNRPKVVIAFGGYLSVPVCFAAKVLLIKIVVHEQTSASGLANKVVSKLANKIYLTWPQKDVSSKASVVGIPLRDEIIKCPQKKLNKFYKIKTIYFQGGKQGSHLLNSFVFKNLDFLTKNFKIIHQTSTHSEYKDFEKSKKLAKKYEGSYYPFDFIFGENYTKVLKQADLLVSRSGAHMAFEASFLKMPTIFIPIKGSSNNEQYANAQSAKQYTPSVIIDQDKLNLSSFEFSVKELLSLIQNSTEYFYVEEHSTQKMYQAIKSAFLV